MRDLLEEVPGLSAELDAMLRDLLRQEDQEFGDVLPVSGVVNAEHDSNSLRLLLLWSYGLAHFQKDLWELMVDGKSDRLHVGGILLVLGLIVDGWSQK